MAPWPPAEVTRTARDRLLPAGAVWAGFHTEDVTAHSDALLVLFRWRDNPSRFGIRFRFPGDAPVSEWTGLPVDSCQAWADDLAGLLTEEVLTGFVARARRRPRDDFIELLWPQRTASLAFYLTAVEHGAGWPEQLAHPAAPARRAHGPGRLIGWFQAVTDDERSAYLGQAVVTWEPAASRTARLDLVRVVADAPADVFPELARRAIDEAANHGATRVITDLRSKTLIRYGFRPVPGTAEYAVETSSARIYPIA
ncbi:hypothetical protein [Paractinoplanes rishiriensis]|uniref:Uncharacterized protein n=1 Tax=Paractinoplanes rishiriensis TaxID=1050105 RepID=A0A919K6M5_9ACTN|nr:hypothetical protein [Actinoplanes rishiriensis]GIF00620.1 hypothetical protein Ari01nite_80840 [Actinoplanes rishiriensis]